MLVLLRSSSMTHMLMMDAQVAPFTWWRRGCVRRGTPRGVSPTKASSLRYLPRQDSQSKSWSKVERILKLIGKKWEEWFLYTSGLLTLISSHSPIGFTMGRSIPLEFQRCVCPDNSIGSLDIIAFSNGSSLAYCYCLYLRWPVMVKEPRPWVESLNSRESWVTLIQSCTHSPTKSVLTHSLNNSFTHSASHSLTDALTYLSSHSLSLTQSLINSLSNSFNHSLTH